MGMKLCTPKMKSMAIVDPSLCRYHVHMNVTPPGATFMRTKGLGAETRAETRDDGSIPAADEVETFAFHQDSARVNKDLPLPRPRLSLKVAFFLTDLREEGAANMWVVPGSTGMDVLAVPESGLVSCTPIGCRRLVDTEIC